jgi:serine/threonine protein phosphatase PrpC
LCTDGISDAVRQSEIDRIISQPNPPQEKCEDLVKAAMRHHARDEVTAVLVEIVD